MSKRRGSYFGSSTIIKGSTEERSARAKYLNERMRNHLAEAEEEKERVRSLYAQPAEGSRLLRADEVKSTAFAQKAAKRERKRARKLAAKPFKA